VTTSRIRAVLFDMDGTLIDTLPDIAAAVNDALAALGLRRLPEAHIATLIGNGPRVLSRRALEAQDQLDAAERERLVEPLLAGYAGNYATQLGTAGSAFPGAADMLRELSRRGLRLGVVSNALQHLAEAVLARFGLAEYLQIVVGGDRVGGRHKPHPEHLWHACARLDVRPNETLMVGDSVNDVSAARAAGCAIVCVPHGYDQGQPVTSLGCDVLVDLAALPDWIDAHARAGGADPGRIGARPTLGGEP
jgi:phosphoglycolate phosphatase